MQMMEAASILRTEHSRIATVLPGQRFHVYYTVGSVSYVCGLSQSAKRRDCCVNNTSKKLLFYQEGIDKSGLSPVIAIT